MTGKIRNDQSSVGNRVNNRCQKLAVVLPNLLSNCVEEDVETALFGTWQDGAFGWVGRRPIEQCLIRPICEALSLPQNAETNGIIARCYVAHPDFKVYVVCTRPSTEQARLVATECLRQIVDALKVRVGEGDPELPLELLDAMYVSRSWIQHEARSEVAAAVLDNCFLGASQERPNSGTSKRLLSLLTGVLAAREESHPPSGVIAFAPKTHRRLFGEKSFLDTNRWRLRHNAKHVAKLLLGTPKGYELAINEEAVLGIIPKGNNQAVRATFDRSCCTVTFGPKELFFVTPEGLTTRSPKSVPTAAALKEWSNNRLVAKSAKNLRALAVRIHERGHGGTVVLQDDLEIEKIKCHRISGLQIPDPKSLAAFTEVDGAVLLNWGMDCLGFGGLLMESCHENCNVDHSRGSRYNSSLNYSWQNPHALVLVFSSDGGLTVLKRGTILFPVLAKPPDLLKKLQRLAGGALRIE